MSGIRDKKKEKTRREILEAAKSLFIKKGYDEVSMQEIANIANVGTGTLYNYYKNKGDIFVASIQEEFEGEIAENHEMSLMPNSNKSIQEIMIDMVNDMLTKYEWIFSKKIMKGFIKATVSVSAGKEKWFKSLAEVDMKYIKNIEGMLDKLKDIGLFKGNSKHYSEMVYSNIAYEIIMYIYFDNLTMEQAKINIREKIKILFS